jgi:peptidoglycan/LPS O-acetylase OafA/YrhL
MTEIARPGPLADGYRPEIDGLRALAIIAVVLHHAAPEALPGGFVGVDVFFVISGYLITAIIAAALAEGRFSLLGFWERRVRRIVPALAAMLITVLAFGWALLTPEDFYSFIKALGASALFGSNLLFARDVDYFDTGGGSEALIHTWTLGVEEQFYLLFPLLLLAVWRWRPGAVLPVLVVLALASFGLALALIPRWPLGAFYLLPTRMWELLLGGVAALLPRPQRGSEVLALAGLGLIAVGIARIHPWTGAPGPLFLLPTLGTALTLLFAREGTAAARVLSWRPAVLVGLVSFGLYLWHQPALYVTGYLWIEGPPWPARVAAVGIALGLAAASYSWLERPVRERRLLASPRRLLLVCGAGLAVPLAAGAAGYSQLLLPRSGAEAARLDGLKPAEIDEAVVIPPDGPLGFVLYGDSHAAQYYTVLTERFGPGALISMPGCLAADGLSNKAAAWGDAGPCSALPDRLAALVRTRGVRTVIWAQRWERTLYPAGSSTILGETTDDRGASALLAAIERTRARLPQGTRIILMGNSPTAWAGGDRFFHGWLRCRAAIDVDCPTSYPETRAEGRTISARLAAFAAARPGYAFIDPRPALCRAGACLLVQDGTLNYYDGSHLTRSGARRVTATIDPALIVR